MWTHKGLFSDFLFFFCFFGFLKECFGCFGVPPIFWFGLSGIMGLIAQLQCHSRKVVAADERMVSEAVGDRAFVWPAELRFVIG